MNPVVHTAATSTANTTRNDIAQPKVATPVTAAPPQPAVHARTANPALLNLKLNLAQNPGETDTHSAAPGSPSSRGTNRHKRAVTESRGQKRAIDSADGPGLSSTKSSKRQRESTPPGSPRNGNSAKTLLKTGRAVADLKTMASLSPRRSETASPPASPRTGETAERQVVGSPRRDTDTRSSSSSTATPSASAAPRWRSASYSETFDSPLHFQRKLAPRVTSVSMASMASVGGMDHTPGIDDPLAPLSRATSSDESLDDFVFTDCKYGDDGVLVPAKLEHERERGSTLTPALVQAELALAWEPLKLAQAGYLTVLDECFGKTRTGKAGAADASDSKGRFATFKTVLTTLDTDMMLAELALGQGNADDSRQVLASMRKTLATSRTAMMSLAGSEVGKRAGNQAGAQDALVRCLQSLETACINGLGMLTDQQASQASTATTTSTASTASTTAPGPLVFTHSNQQLLDDLDSLMDDEIGPAKPKPGGKSSARQ